MTAQEQNIQLGNSTSKISGINSENERGNEMLKTEKQNWLVRNLGNVVPVKLLAGLAVAAMMITAIGIPGSGVSADEPSRPLDNPSLRAATDVYSNGLDLPVENVGAKSTVNNAWFDPMDQTIFDAMNEQRGSKAGRIDLSVYSNGLDLPVENVGAKSTVNNSWFDPMDQTIFDAMNEQRGSKAGRIDLSVYSNGLDLVVETSPETFP